MSGVKKAERGTDVLIESVLHSNGARTLRIKGLRSGIVIERVLHPGKSTKAQSELLLEALKTAEEEEAQIMSKLSCKNPRV
jgi:hypothetical protein